MKNIQYIDRRTGDIRLETVPGEKWLRWLYHNPFGKLALETVVKRKFLSVLYGSLMNRASSRSKIDGFIRSLDIDMTESVRTADEFKSFNDFFTRSLKPQARPVDTRPEVIVSPADGKIMAFENFNRLDSFFVKGQEFLLEKFLNDTKLAEKYSGGTLVIVRLAPADYHRFHFPADGHISQSKIINGAYYSVSPYAVKNMLQVYWENKRHYSVLRTLGAGDVLICEVGATMVGAIEQTYTPESDAKKGQEKGLFRFGGSTVIMLLEKGKAVIDADIIRNTQNGYETCIRMGESIACVK